MKVRGTTITTPVPKSVYFLDYNEGYGWGVDGFDYKSAVSALGKGQVLILRIEPISDMPKRYLVCTENSNNGYLTFIGTENEKILEVVLFPDGQMEWLWFGDTSSIRDDVEALRYQMEFLPFKELTGTSSNPVVIRDLESGIYMVNGKTKMYSTAGVFNSAWDFYLVSKYSANTTAVKISTSAHSMHRYKITDTTSETTSCNLSDIASSVTSLTSQVDNLKSSVKVLNAPQNKVYTTRPDVGPYYGAIVRVDPSGQASDNTEVWMYVGYDYSKGSPVWKKIAIEPDN